MKTLILALIFSGTSLANGTGEVTDQQAIRKLVSVARDVENEKILEGVTELQDCKRQHPVTPSTSGGPPQGLAALQGCISRKFQGRSADDMKRISESLKLEAFELIPSTSTENITKYLTNKVYQSMTGVDLNDQDQIDKTKFIKSQKFGTKKMLDQSDFFELYKNQMSKNVIYEISRFCFVDLRDSSKPQEKTFIGHWDLTKFTNPDQIPNGVTLSDNGEPKFDLSAQGSTTAPDADAAYPDIVRSITGNGTAAIDPKDLFVFFQFCAKQMNKLCEDYEKKCKDSSISASNTCAGLTGGRACLSKNRIITFRRALAASDDTIKKFLADKGNDVSVAFDPNQTIKRYNGGRDQGEKSYNQLTNSASIDIFKANEGEDYKKAEECVKTGGSECDEFSIVDDSVARIESNTEVLFTAKREAEMARIRELKKANDQSLSDYLDKNYPDLKMKYLADPGGFKLEDAIAQRWDGQKEAMIAEIKSRIGVRQITEEKAKEGDTKIKTAKKNAQVALDERSRLAQVVLFNNIISSSLQLTNATTRQSAGTNTQTLTNELDSAETEVKGNLFQGLRSIADSGNSNNSNTADQGSTISDIGFLYKLIGLQDDDQTPGTQGTSGRRSP